MEKTRTVYTGTVTGVMKYEGTIVDLGDESFDITFADAGFAIQVNDMTSTSYSKKKKTIPGGISFG